MKSFLFPELCRAQDRRWWTHMVERMGFAGLFSSGCYVRSHLLWVETHQPIANPVSEAMTGGGGVAGSRCSPSFSSPPGCLKCPMFTLWPKLEVWKPLQNAFASKALGIRRCFEPGWSQEHAVVGKWQVLAFTRYLILQANRLQGLSSSIRKGQVNASSTGKLSHSDI